MILLIHLISQIDVHRLERTVLALFFLCLLGVTFSACEDSTDDVLPCREIFEAQSLPVTVDLYQWNGERYYLVDFGCCDFFLEVYELGCEYVCAPGGGITGEGDGLCPSFFDEALLVERVYTRGDE